MSKDTKQSCRLVGPGHNVPDAENLLQKPLKQIDSEIKLLGNKVFRIGSCECGLHGRSQRTNPSNMDLNFDFNLDHNFAQFDSYPYKDQRLGCSNLFTTHDVNGLLAALEQANGNDIYEIEVGYPHSLVLYVKSSDKLFWLQGNDGSINPRTPVFQEISWSMPETTSLLNRNLNLLFGPVVGPCLGHASEVFYEVI